MSNGVDMLEMVCNSYESPPDEGAAEDGEDEEEAEQFDFSEWLSAGVLFPACVRTHTKA
jgi:hypothetical protein